LVAVLVQGCTESAAPSVDSAAATSLQVAGPRDSLEAQEFMQFIATVRDLTGRVIPGATVSWSVSDASALAIASSGIATAQDVSIERGVYVIARHATLTDSTRVTVLPHAFPTRRQPIVFVHGFNGSAADFDPVIQRFRRDGWVARELSARTYPNVSNTANGAVVQAEVDSVRAATGWDRDHIVSNSMGSLSSRHYLKQLGGTERTESWTSISGPNHGTASTLLALCSSLVCQEMRPGSSFLAALNDGDETPGTLRYATWRSPCDELVIPAESTILNGAQNSETECLLHAAMFTEGTYQQVRSFIRP
jgi:triacylglycerol lipase